MLNTDDDRRLRGDVSALKVGEIQPKVGTRCESNIYARTYPGPSWPFGMVQPGPDNITGWDYTNGYSYDLRYIEGFSLMRMSGTGWYGDFGNFQIMPTTGELQTYRGIGNKREGARSTNGWHSPFFHRDETVLPGYYGVLLHRYNIYAEMTASRHCGIMRFTFPKSDRSRIQVDLARRIGGTSTEQCLTLVDDCAIEGWMRCGPEGGGMGNGQPKDLKYKLHFRAEFSRPLKTYGTWTVSFPTGTLRNRNYIESEEYAERCRAADVHPGQTEARGEHIGFFAGYGTTKGEQISMKVGVSFVDIDGARRNLENEISKFDFERVRSEVAHEWDKTLSLLKAAAIGEHDRIIAATAMYHTHLDPRRIDDYDGRFVDGEEKCENDV